MYISLSPGNPVQFSVDGGGYFFQADNSEAVLGQLEDRVRGIEQSNADIINTDELQSRELLELSRTLTAVGSQSDAAGAGLLSVSARVTALEDAITINHETIEDLQAEIELISELSPEAKELLTTILGGMADDILLTIQSQYGSAIGDIQATLSGDTSSSVGLTDRSDLLESYVYGNTYLIGRTASGAPAELLQYSDDGVYALAKKHEAYILGGDVVVLNAQGQEELITYSGLVDITDDLNEAVFGGTSTLYGNTASICDRLDDLELTIKGATTGVLDRLEQLERVISRESIDKIEHIDNPQQAFVRLDGGTCYILNNPITTLSILGYSGSGEAELLFITDENFVEVKFFDVLVSGVVSTSMFNAEQAYILNCRDGIIVGSALRNPDNTSITSW